MQRTIVVYDDDPPADPGSCPICCTRCGARANGRAYAHCGARGCHRTFSSVSGFDRHRRDGQCVDPATVGLVEVTRSGWTRWQFPGPEEKISYGG